MRYINKLGKYLVILSMFLAASLGFANTSNESKDKIVKSLKKYRLHYQQKM